MGPGMQVYSRYRKVQDQDGNPVPVEQALRLINAALGEVRDLDVQIASLARAGSGLRAESEALRAVLCLFDARRSAARDALHSALATHRFATLVTGLRDLAEQPGPDRADDGLDQADRLIRRTHRRLRKAGEQLHPEASPATLHRARIRAKQFRYALECFSELYGKPARRLMRRAARLQDVLGGAQDAAVLQELLRLLSQPEHDLPPTSVFLLGQLSEVYAERMRLARAEAPAAYNRLTGRPWKRLKQRARFNELLGEEHVAEIVKLLKRSMQRLRAAQHFAELVLEDLGIEKLLGVFPLVERLGFVEALVALQADHLHAAPGGNRLGKLSLADARGAFDQDRLLDLLR